MSAQETMDKMLADAMAKPARDRKQNMEAAVIAVLPKVTEIVFKEELKEFRYDSDKNSCDRAGWLAANIVKEAFKNLDKEYS